MTNFKTFKKVVALTAAIALVVCFAVSASAAGVAINTTTTYANGGADVDVDVTVTGLGQADYATYYASNSNGTVYIDQVAVNKSSGEATFNFRTEAENLKSAVNVGFTDNSGAAKTDVIKGKTISVVGNDYTKTIPTAETTLTDSFEYELAANKEIDATCVTATVGTVSAASYESSTGMITISLSGITADTELTITPKDAEVPMDVTLALVTKGAVNITPENAGVDTDGKRKLTVVGRATGTNVVEWGAIVSENAITASDKGIDETAFNAYKDDAWKAQVKGSAGIFAVQLVDTETGTATFVKPNTTYNVAVYVKATNGKYFITASETVAIN